MTRIYEGFKVVQCIKINSYSLFIAAVFPKDQKKTEPGHEKNLFKGVSDQVVLKLKHAQLHKNN